MILDADVLTAVRQLNPDERMDMWETFAAFESVARHRDTMQDLVDHWNTAGHLPPGPERDAIRAELRRLIVTVPPPRRATP